MPSPKVTRLAAALIAEIMRQAETSGITRFELQKTSVSLCAAKELAAQGHRWVCENGKIFFKFDNSKYAIMSYTKVSDKQYGMMNKELAGKILSACSGKFRGPDILFGVYSNESGTYVNWRHTHRHALEEMEADIGPSKYLLDWSKSILEGEMKDDPDGSIVEAYWRRATYLYKCDKLFRGASYVSKQHYATTTGPVGILFFLWRTFKAGYISEMAQDSKWPQNDQEYDLPYMEWAEIFESILGDKLKAEVESWD